MGFFNTPAKRATPAPTTPSVTTPRCSMAELFRVVRASLDPTTFSLTTEQRIRIGRETGHNKSINVVEERLYDSLMAAEEARLLIGLGDVKADESSVYAAILQRDALHSVRNQIEESNNDNCEELGNIATAIGSRS